MKPLIAAALLCLISPSLYSQQSQKTIEPSPTQTRTTAPTDDAQATREDIQRMKSLVQQMQANLAAATSSQGPLKHQFELEIEMWQLEIARLQRQLGQPTAVN